jgi:hypothetical protein
VGSCSDLGTHCLLFDVVDVNVCLHSTTHTVRCLWRLAEGNAFYTVGMGSETSSNFSGLVVGVAHLSL